MNTELQAEKTFTKAKNYALYLISYRPRTRQEIVEKLTKKGFSSENIEAVLDFLAEYNFINDQSYASQWVNHRCRAKPMGRKRLFMEMCQKGLGEEVIDTALSQISREEEFNMALTIAEKKYLRQTTPQGLERVKGFLYRRGFSSEVIGMVSGVLKRLNLDSDAKNL
ncbi:MAG: regulatory protein RecX [Thermincolia bacterium]